MRIRKMPLGNANMIGERVEQLRNINNMKQKDLLYLLNSKGVVLGCKKGEILVCVVFPVVLYEDSAEREAGLDHTCLGILCNVENIGIVFVRIFGGSILEPHRRVDDLSAGLILIFLYILKILESYYLVLSEAYRVVIHRNVYVYLATAVAEVVVVLVHRHDGVASGLL